jgi:hypothetical protein
MLCRYGLGCSRHALIQIVQPMVVSAMRLCRPKLQERNRSRRVALQLCRRTGGPRWHSRRRARAPHFAILIA